LTVAFTFTRRNAHQLQSNSSRRRFRHNTGFTTTPKAGAMAEDTQSWISLYVCLILSVVFIIARLYLRRLRHQSFTHGDYWCIATAVFILARLVGNHVLLIYGSTRREYHITADIKMTTDTNSVLSESRRVELLNGYDERALFRVVMGSKLVLCTRSLLICM
jgi:hypothetical protein